MAGELLHHLEGKMEVKLVGLGLVRGVRVAGKLLHHLEEKMLYHLM